MQAFSADVEAQANLIERRGKPRVSCSYPAIVRGVDVAGSGFRERAVLANMSASGMYFRIRRFIPHGENVDIVVHLSTSPLSQAKAPRIAACGSVVRVEPLPDGSFGVALKLAYHRFL